MAGARRHTWNVGSRSSLGLIEACTAAVGKQNTGSEHTHEMSKISALLAGRATW